MFLKWSHVLTLVVCSCAVTGQRHVPIMQSILGKSVMNGMGQVMNTMDVIMNGASTIGLGMDRMLGTNIIGRKSQRKQQKKKSSKDNSLVDQLLPGDTPKQSLKTTYKVIKEEKVSGSPYDDHANYFNEERPHSVGQVKRPSSVVLEPFYDDSNYLKDEPRHQKYLD
ncbi:unnamed protein product, partial [Meganyctiphanes norvegica]